jgi:steroid delta-isomerase-like uncharacterized protein
MAAIDIAKAWINSANARHWESFLKLYATDAVVYCEQLGVNAVGEQAIRDQVVAWDTDVPDCHYNVHRVTASEADGLAVLECDFTGTLAVAVDGLPPVGEQFTLPLCITMDIADGLIVRERIYCDWPPTT